MKLHAEVEIVNRSLATHNMKVKSAIFLLIGKTYSSDIQIPSSFLKTT